VLNRWDAYSDAIKETLDSTHTDVAPWIVVRSDDKRRERLNTIRSILSRTDYAGRDDARLGAIDPKVAGTHG
jgi:polyphosphate kinase 2 (PPK2 family)